MHKDEKDMSDTTQDRTRSCSVLFLGQAAGRLTEDRDGYRFSYNSDYLARPDAAPISVCLPLRKEVFFSRELHPFFDGLLPEGWTLDIVVRNSGIDPRDRMGLLLATCEDCVGAVSILADPPEESG